MPKIMEILGYIIYFWSNEGQPSEQVHVHIAKRPSKNGTKVWLRSDGTVQLESNKSQIPSKELKRLMNTIADYHDIIIEEWKKFFNVESVKFIDERENQQSISRRR